MTAPPIVQWNPEFFCVTTADEKAFSGIGLETTILFAREGANVLMADISAPALEKAIAKVQKILPNSSVKVETTTCDVSKESDVAKMVEHLDTWGGCDIIFNNAGIMHADDAGKHRRALAINLPDLRLRG